MKRLLWLCCLAWLAGPLALAQQVWIEGQVQEAGSGAPLPGANVVLPATQQGTTTGPDGTFRLGPVAPGRYVLQVSFVGFQTLAETVDVGTAPVRLTLALSPVLLEADEVVVTGTRQSEKLLDAPVTIETITAADLTRTGGGTFLSALAGLKGIDFVDAGINAQGISARGFNSQFNTRMLAMTDGRMAQLPGTGLPQGNFLPTAPLDVKAIEVVVGPASALYGPNAHTGVVNVITKDPWDEAGVSLAARTGERSLIDVTGRAAGTAGAFGWKVTGQYLEADDFEPSREEGLHDYGTSIYEGDVLRDLDGYHIRSAKLEGFLYYRLGAWQAQGGAGYSTNDNFGLTNNGRNHIRGWEVLYQTVQVSHPHWYAQFTHTKNDAGKTYQLNAVVQAAAAQVAAGVPLEQVDLDALRRASMFVDRGALLDGEVQYRHDLPFLQGRVVTGLQMRRYRPDSDGTFLADAGGEDLSATEVGGYAQLDLRLVPDRLRLVTAARLDGHSNYSTQFSPKAALVYTALPGHNVRVGYNRAFKSPTILENYLFIPIRRFDLAPGYYVNAFGNRDGYVIKDPAGQVVSRVDGLEPEQVDALELGYKGAFGSRAFVDVVGYYSWYRNFISPLTLVADGFTQIAYEADGTTPVVAPASDAAFNGLLTYLNFGRAQVAGLDAGLTLYPSPYVTLSGSVSLISLRSFTEAAGQTELPLNVPETKLKGNVTVRNVGLQGYFVSLSARYQSAYRFVSGYWNSETLLPDGEVPARTVLDLTLGYKVPRTGLDLTLSISNLLDEAGYDALGAPVRGRFVWFGLTYHLPGLRF
ncbi:TonB-dependent receptor [Rhodocaloribacter litoris]|uniref:TonB-dependent receptor n=1 Tax=Rhodocaloribacter litoris TaxID=2558931 RepID=UPI00141DDE91|nr:TonB-dependent receptor [Rhodocaloribacter litoris]QXD16263.1 TonB-dependent receptor [Rhodocaloribacter litoris]